MYELGRLFGCGVLCLHKVCMYGLQLQKLAGLAAAPDGRAAFMIERSKVLYMGLESKSDTDYFDITGAPALRRLLRRVGASICHMSMTTRCRFYLEVSTIVCRLDK